MAVSCLGESWKTLSSGLSESHGPITQICVSGFKSNIPEGTMRPSPNGWHWQKKPSLQIVQKEAFDLTIFLQTNLMSSSEKPQNY